jgi:hypothetical protein
MRQWRERRRLRRRGLYEYFDGRQWRFVDPYALFRRITTDATVNLAEIGPAAQQGREPEVTQLAEFVCGHFEVQRFDPATRVGLTDAELLGLLSDFWGYVEALKKNGARGVT